MRSINRISQPAQNARIFQLEIFWPTLESILGVREEIAVLDQEENQILRGLIAGRTLVDIDKTLLRQHELALARADKLAEVERKWALIHAGCQFIAMMLNEGRTEAEATLTPDLVYATLVRGEALDVAGYELA